MSKITTKEAFAVLAEALKEDNNFAHGWHCNIAMSCYDAGATHKVANEGASRFMKLCFDVDTSNDMLSENK